MAGIKGMGTQTSAISRASDLKRDTVSSAIVELEGVAASLLQTSAIFADLLDGVQDGGVEAPITPSNFVGRLQAAISTLRSAQAELVRAGNALGNQ